MDGKIWVWYGMYCIKIHRSILNILCEIVHSSARNDPQICNNSDLKNKE